MLPCFFLGNLLACVPVTQVPQGSIVSPLTDVSDTSGKATVSPLPTAWPIAAPSDAPILLLPDGEAVPLVSSSPVVSPTPSSFDVVEGSAETGAGGSNSGGTGGPNIDPTPVPIPLGTPAPIVRTLPLPASMDSGGIVLSESGMLYVPTAQGVVLAYTEAGDLDWEVDLGTAISTFPTLGSDGSLYLSGENGSVYALGSDGQMRWTFTPEEPNHFRLGGLALDENGILYTGGTFETLYALDSSDGSEVWRFKARAPLDNVPVVSGERVYVLALDQTLYALDRTDGSYLWEFQTGRPISNLASALTQAEDIVFGSQDPWIYAVDRDGFELWSYITETGLSASPVIDDYRNTYVPTQNGKLYSFDIFGDLNWVFDTQATLKASPVLGNAEEIYVGNEAGELFAPSTFTGQLQWSRRFEHAITGKLVLDQAGKLYVTLSNGEVVVLQTGSTGPAGEWPMQQHNAQGQGRL